MTKNIKNYSSNWFGLVMTFKLNRNLQTFCCGCVIWCSANRSHDIAFTKCHFSVSKTLKKLRQSVDKSKL